MSDDAQTIREYIEASGIRGKGAPGPRSESVRRRPRP